MAFSIDEGQDLKIMVQEANIGKLRLSVDKLVEHGNEVSLTKKNPHIKNVKTGRVTKLIRRRGQFTLRMYIQKKSSSQAFTRQGS